MSPMRTRKARRVSERAEEPVEPVKATKTPPRDTTVLDKLLDEIEEVLEPEPEKPPEGAIDWPTVAAMLKLDNLEDYQIRFMEQKPEPAMGEMMRYYREAGDQRRLYLDYEGEYYQTDPECDLPWDDIAKLPPPGPGGTTVEFVVPEEIEWLAEADPTVIAPLPRTRVIHVTRVMWEEARSGRGWRRVHGDDGICPQCHHPLAGPGYPPCGNAGTEQDEARERARRYPWPAMPLRRPEDVAKIVGNT